MVVRDHMGSSGETAGRGWVIDGHVVGGGHRRLVGAPSFSGSRIPRKGRASLPVPQRIHTLAPSFRCCGVALPPFPVDTHHCVLDCIHFPVLPVRVETHLRHGPCVSATRFSFRLCVGISLLLLLPLAFNQSALQQTRRTWATSWTETGCGSKQTRQVFWVKTVWCSLCLMR